MKQKPRELKRFVIADLGLVPKPSKHSWVMILWLLLIIIIVSMPKAGVKSRTKRDHQTEQSVVNIFGQRTYQC